MPKGILSDEHGARAPKAWAPPLSTVLAGPVAAIALFGTAGLGLHSDAVAKVSPEKANELGTTLTPVGATKEGNKEGTIPAWTGGITKPQPGYSKGDHHPNPYAGDKALFTITAANMEKYRHRLTAGQIALLTRYPTFEMHVYRTRRSAAYPAYVYQAIKENATRATLVDDGNGVADATISSPFPFPQNGREAIWNVLLRYRGAALRRDQHDATVTARGDYTTARLSDQLLYPYSVEGARFEDLDNISLYLRRRFVAPARMAGSILLVHETINMVREQRHVWLYSSGVRRVTRAPYVAYDSPWPTTDGIEVSDQFDMYNGAIDRYDWKLEGKREIYVPYNAYKLHKGGLSYDDIIRPRHIEPDLARYELHRVWKVVATLKKGKRHLYASRAFYLDEDSWQPLVIDIFDARGKVWRVAEGHVINYYEVPTLWTTVETVYDLQSYRYRATGLNNKGYEYDFSTKLTRRDFLPSSLRRAGMR